VTDKPTVSRMISVGMIVKKWRPGSHDEPWSWLDETVDLIQREGPTFGALINWIREHGVEPNPEEPVLLGDDWRVWDGHHRICAAALVGEGVLVPVELAPGIVRVAGASR
jgi:hypothetical protein